MGQFLLVLVVYWQHRLINKDINEGSINVGQKVYDNLENTLECALTVESFWRTDYSNGFHNSDLYESSALTSMEEMKRALFKAKKPENNFKFITGII